MKAVLVTVRSSHKHTRFVLYRCGHFPDIPLMSPSFLRLPSTVKLSIIAYIYGLENSIKKPAKAGPSRRYIRSVEEAVGADFHIISNRTPCIRLSLFV